MGNFLIKAPVLLNILHFSNLAIGPYIIYTFRAGPATIFLASRQRQRHNVIELQLQAKIRKIVKASVSTWSSQDEYTVDLLQ